VIRGHSLSLAAANPHLPAGAHAHHVDYASIVIPAPLITFDNPISGAIFTFMFIGSPHVVAGLAAHVHPRASQRLRSATCFNPKFPPSITHGSIPPLESWLAQPARCSSLGSPLLIRLGVMGVQLPHVSKQ
jgi:hypothetical protein